MPIGEQDPAQKGITDGAQSPIMTRRQFNRAALTGIGVVGLDELVSPLRSGAKTLGDGANFLMKFADLADKRDASLNAWLERFDGLPIEKESFTLFAEKDGRSNTYQLGFTVRDSSLIPDNDKPYTQISIHGVTKDQAKEITQVFGGTKLTTVGETNLFTKIAKIGGGAGVGALLATVVGSGLKQAERNKLIAEGAAIGAGAAALLEGAGVFTMLALLPPEKRRELFDSLLRSINEKLQPIFNIFNGSARNLQSNEPTPISQAVTAIFTPRPSPSATVTFTPTHTETPTPTVTAKPSETPKPTETPRPTFEVKVTPEHKLVNENGEVLKGSVITPFTIVTDKRPRSSNVRLDVDELVRNGGNTAIVTLNAAGFDNPAYLRELLDLLEYGRSKGISMILSLHSNGEVLDKVNNWYNPQQLTTVDGNLKDLWSKLLTNPTYGSDIVKNTSAYILLQEAGEFFNWNNGLPYYLKATDAIRAIVEETTGVKDIPCSFAGGNWARRFGDLLSMAPAPRLNLLLNASPYFEPGRNPNGERIFEQTDQLRAKGWTPFIAELNWRYTTEKTGDTYDDVVRRVGLAKKGGLAYFIWVWEPSDRSQLLPLLK